MAKRDEDNQFQVIAGNRLQRNSLFDPHFLSQPAIQTIDGAVQIGMGADNGDVITDRGPKDFSNSIIRG